MCIMLYCKDIFEFNYWLFGQIVFGNLYSIFTEEMSSIRMLDFRMLLFGGPPSASMGLTLTVPIELMLIVDW